MEEPRGMWGTCSEGGREGRKEGRRGGRLGCGAPVRALAGGRANNSQDEPMAKFTEAHRVFREVKHGKCIGPAGYKGVSVQTGAMEGSRLSAGLTALRLLPPLLPPFILT